MDGWGNRGILPIHKHRLVGQIVGLPTVHDMLRDIVFETLARNIVIQPYEEISKTCFSMLRDFYHITALGELVKFAVPEKLFSPTEEIIADTMYDEHIVRCV